MRHILILTDKNSTLEMAELSRLLKTGKGYSVNGENKINCN